MMNIEPLVSSPADEIQFNSDVASSSVVASSPQAAYDMNSPTVLPPGRDESSSQVASSSESSDDVKLGPLEMKLTALEQNAPRRYINIAMAFSCHRWEGLEIIYYADIKCQVTKAFINTLDHWPFLAGCFRRSDTEPGKLIIKYQQNIDKRAAQNLVEFKAPERGVDHAYKEVYALPMAEIGKERFPFAESEDDGLDPILPVALTISFVNNVLVLGFAFSETLFDAEFIQLFFKEFIKNTRGTGSQAQVTTRNMPERIKLDPVDKQLFRYYDWNTQHAPQLPADRKNLRCQVMNLTCKAVEDLMATARLHILDTEHESSVTAEETIFALFWIAIMAARIENSAFHAGCVAEANILVPGALASHRWQRRLAYFGNTTAVAIAKCHARNLLGNPAPEVRGTLCEPELIIRAASLIRSAIQEINGQHMAKLNTFKEHLSPAEDRAAYDRGIKRSTNSLVFEDWSSFGGKEGAYIPTLADDKPSFFPSNDHMQEGSVILLPRKHEPLVHEDWQVCVCLLEEDFEILCALLDGDGWWTEPTAA